MAMWSGSLSRRIYALLFLAVAAFLTWLSFDFPWPHYLHVCAFASMFALLGAGLALRVRWIYRLMLFREAARLLIHTLRLIARLTGRPGRPIRSLLLAIAVSAIMLIELLTPEFSREFEGRPDPAATIRALAIASVPLLLSALRAVLGAS